ncbi:glutathione S-transferase [Acrasis kona]|uniref:Glutathione S-transferase n=1 Tax=Acrasis kona TaxID=1008807 RepID=A0AAW2ZKC0_9EUKA
MSNDSNLTLYWLKYSPYACRPSILLCEKQQKFNSHVVDFSVQENRSAEFLKISPKGKVPALIDSETGVTIYESYAILSYLEEKYGTVGPSFSENPKARAQALIRSSEIDNYFIPASHKYFGAWYVLTDEERSDESGENEKVKQTDVAYEQLISEFQKYDDVLKQQKERGQPLYLVGDEFSVADIMFLPLLLFFEHVKLDFSAESNRLGNVIEYLEGNKKRPSVRDGYPAFWNGDETKFDTSKYMQAYHKRKCQ